MATDIPDKGRLEISMSEGLRSPYYANTVITNVTKSETTLTFAYVNINDNPAGTVVSRIALPNDVALDFSKSLKANVETNNELNNPK